ncbi:hypothetical protein AMTRI_Chr06g194570 [Amborella trichopoda]
MNTRETAFAIRKLPLAKAKRYREDVLAHKQAIPFRRFCGGVKGLDVDTLFISHIQAETQVVPKRTKKSQALRSGASS